MEGDGGETICFAKVNKLDLYSFCYIILLRRARQLNNKQSDRAP